MKKYILTISLFFLTSCVAGFEPGYEEQNEALRLVDEGVLHMREGELEVAEAKFELANDLVISAAAIDGLGCIAFIRGEDAKAEELFWQAYEADSTYNNSLGNLALLYEKQGKTELARETFQKALQEDPRNFKMRNNYAAYLNDNKAAKSRTFSELLKAQALFNHPVIYDNIKMIKEH